MFLGGKLRAPGECGKSINRKQGGISKLCHFVSSPEVSRGCNSHVSPIFLQPLLSRLKVLGGSADPIFNALFLYKRHVQYEDP